LFDGNATLGRTKDLRHNAEFDEASFMLAVEQTSLPYESGSKHPTKDIGRLLKRNASRRK
jgi:hypothetical protein